MALPTTHRAADRHARPAASSRSRSTRSRSRAAEGYFGVLPGHTPLLAALAVGELWYRKGQEKTYLSIAFGFAEVLPDRVTILARLAERAEDIDVERAEAARASAPRSGSPQTHRSRRRLRAGADRADEVADAAAGFVACSAWAATGGMKRMRDAGLTEPS